MIRCLARWLLVLALSFSIGLPWAFLQSAAWMGMIVSFAQEVPLAKAVAMTFDGKHPCKICKAAQRGESSQKKQDTTRASVKIELAAPEHDDFSFPSYGPQRTVFLVHAVCLIPAEPLLPPPRPA
ncbi:MAG: hypothetical protein WCN98_03495 [Verrucomicrobiaceae bacterium]